MQVRKELLVVLAVSLLAAGGGTVSYLTAYSQRENETAIGVNTTTIEEVFPDPDPVPVPENPEYTKTVWVSNQSSGEDGFCVDCYVRVLPVFSNADLGRAVTLKNLNTTDWEYRDDGYYYYKYVLKEGESTSPLFRGFSISSDQVEDTYRSFLREFSISVYEESIQAEGFADYRAAWDYFLNSDGTA